METWYSSWRWCSRPSRWCPPPRTCSKLPNKLPLPRDEYITVQQVYRGWNRFGFVVIAAPIVTLWLAILAEGPAETPATLAVVAILATQVVFWAITFPVNRRTHNWTTAPDDWERLRDRWELSHAASTVLNFIAFVAVALAVLED